MTDAGALLLTTDSDESSSQECGGEAALRGCRGVTLAGGAAIGRRRRGARRGHGDGAGGEGFVFNGYAAKRHFDDDANYYMEREWRVGGNISFQLGDVARVFFPSSYAVRFRADLPTYIGQITFID